MTYLKLRSLEISLRAGDRNAPLLRGVDLEIGPGEAVGVVGESGSGKSLTGRAILGLFPRGSDVSGEIVFDGRSVLHMDAVELQAYRGRDVAMIFQDARSHINPVRTIGDFLCEGMRSVQGLSRNESERRAITLLEEVGISDGIRRLGQYPHELSGGLLQRVMIASAIAVRPKLVVADEPTSALDVSTQSEVLQLLDRLRVDHKMAMMFVTHDLEVAAAMCDRTAVMYAGEMLEINGSDQLLDRPHHPYTRALSDARPDVRRRIERLRAIPGQPLNSVDAPRDGCSFAARCGASIDACTHSRPILVDTEGGSARCIRRTEDWMKDIAVGESRTTEVRA